MATNFTVDLTGMQEVPPNASTASGAGTVVWDPATTTATYEFVVNGLDFGPALGLAPQTETTADDVTAMHFHNAAPGVAGPVVFGQLGPAQDADDLQVVPNDDGSWTISGVWETTDPASVPITNFATVLGSTRRCTGTSIPRHSRKARSVGSWSRPKTAARATRVA